MKNDPEIVLWLKELIKQKVLPAGDVDDRSILDVAPEDLNGYTQAHFFAGIGGWAYALKLANWPEDQEVWTGSCPCQPFSYAGKGDGIKDKRHLWPDWYRLIEKQRPPIIFGEQVRAGISHGWLDLVFSDLEEIDYACGAPVLPAASVGAPHRRQRLWFVADTLCSRLERGTGKESQNKGRLYINTTADSGISRMADTNSERSSVKWSKKLSDNKETPRRNNTNRCCKTIWANPEWISCTDGKKRPIKSGIKPLVTGLSKGMVYGGNLFDAANESSEARRVRLHGYGNSIVPQVAAKLISIYKERLNDRIR